jgi:hypothetical protein
MTSLCNLCNTPLDDKNRKGKRCTTCAKRKYRESPSGRAEAMRRAPRRAAVLLAKRQNDPLFFLLEYAAKRARERGLEFSITAKDLQLPATCPLLEIPLFISATRHSDNSPSMDRIDNSLGYIPGNVRVISNLANMMKRTASKEQLLAFAKNMPAYLKQ